jgi:hypothetical protein
MDNDIANKLEEIYEYNDIQLSNAAKNNVNYADNDITIKYYQELYFKQLYDAQIYNTQLYNSQLYNNQLTNIGEYQQNVLQQLPYQQNVIQQIPYQQNVLQQLPYQQNVFQQLPYQQNVLQQLPYQQNVLQQLPYQQNVLQQIPYQEIPIDHNINQEILNDNNINQEILNDQNINQEILNGHNINQEIPIDQNINNEKIYKESKYNKKSDKKKSYQKELYQGELYKDLNYLYQDTNDIKLIDNVDNNKQNKYKPNVEVITDIYFKNYNLYLNNKIQLSDTGTKFIAEYLPYSLNNGYGEKYFFIKDIESENYLSWGAKCPKNLYNIVWINKDEMKRRLLFIYMNGSLIVKMDDYFGLDKPNNLYALTIVHTIGHILNLFIKKYVPNNCNQFARLIKS